MLAVTRVPRPAMPEAASALVRQFPAWTFAYDPGCGVWSAERRRGTEVRFLCDHLPAVLAVKVTAAEAGQ